VDGDAWLRTSRIRYDTNEMKLFKTGLLYGALDVAEIGVTGIAPYGVSQNLGTYGFITNNNPGPFRLNSGLNQWLQLQFDLIGSACIFNGYEAKAIVAPQRQHLIVLTGMCFRDESDRWGTNRVDPVFPRDRFNAVKALEASGVETRLVEFTRLGPVATLVVIDQLIFESYSRPTQTDDFSGYITFKLRQTE
jgi:hypothetical protein